MAEPALTDAISFFDHVSIKHLNKYQLSHEPWRKTLMYFSHTVLSVRYAATALSLLHRNYMYGSTNSPQSPKDLPLADREAPLLHYNMAIRHLLDQDLSGHDGIEQTAITLLVCYLFTCFDHLAANDVQAMKHLQGGVELSRNLDKAIREDSDSHGADSSDLRVLVTQVTSQIRRLDMQAVMFALDWTPSDIQESTMNHLKPSNIAFHSLAQAADSIYMLVAQAIRLRNTDEQMYPIGKSISPPLHSSPKGALLNQLETWLGLFENMLQLQHNSFESNENNMLITLLRLQHKTAWIFTSSYGPGREMEYDAFLPHFQQCVAMASEVTATHDHSSGSLIPTFTPEIGILPILYIMGAKCRHSLVRREVLDLLRRQNTREAAWNSACTARILERIIEIEEGGCGGGTMPPSMDQIPAWQRIEALSWLYVATGNSAPRVDVTYTFCGVEGIHTEVMVL
ncbi:hypothetical protein ACHAPU_006392 [Fusarium lateritium]